MKPGRIVWKLHSQLCCIVMFLGERSRICLMCFTQTHFSDVSSPGSSRARCLSMTITWGIFWRRWSWEFSTCLTSSLQTARTSCVAWSKWTPPRGSRYASSPPSRSGRHATAESYDNGFLLLLLFQSSSLQGLLGLNLVPAAAVLHAVLSSQAQDSVVSENRVV